MVAPTGYAIAWYDDGTKINDDFDVCTICIPTSNIIIVYVLYVRAIEHRVAVLNILTDVDDRCAPRRYIRIAHILYYIG